MAFSSGGDPTHQSHEAAEREGLVEHPYGAEIARLAVGRLVAEGGDQDDRRLPTRAAERGQDVEPAETRHADVGNDRGEGPAPVRLFGEIVQTGDQLAPVARRDDRVAFLP